MKFLPLLSLLFFINTSNTTWQTDFDKALQQAKEEHKYVLVNFSGSDWCIPCIKLHKEVFDNASFLSFANDNLVMVRADFPRLSKNQLSIEQQKKNDLLAEKLDPKGILPYTILMDAKGKILKSWEGFPNLKADEFVSQVKTLIMPAKK